MGTLCNQCRSGSYNLNNITGCDECFCSGVSSNCSSSNLYRQEIVIGDLGEFKLTNSTGYTVFDPKQLEKAFFFFHFDSPPQETLYWSLPKQFLGNQVRAYGGSLRFTVFEDMKFIKKYIPDRDVILYGNGISLFWTRKDPSERV